MSDLYSEFLVKKESTAKDAIVKYGLIVLTILAAGCLSIHCFWFWQLRWELHVIL